MVNLLYSFKKQFKTGYFLSRVPSYYDDILFCSAVLSEGAQRGMQRGKQRGTQGVCADGVDTEGGAREV